MSYEARPSCRIVVCYRCFANQIAHSQDGVQRNPRQRGLPPWHRRVVPDHHEPPYRRRLPQGRRRQGEAGRYACPAIAPEGGAGGAGRAGKITPFLTSPPAHSITPRIWGVENGRRLFRFADYTPYLVYTTVDLSPEAVMFVRLGTGGGCMTPVIAIYPYARIFSFFFRFLCVCVLQYAKVRAAVTDAASPTQVC